MGVVTRRPTTLYYDGPNSYIAGGNGEATLGDQADNTFVSLQSFGTIRSGYPDLAASAIPSGRKIIGPRMFQRWDTKAIGRWFGENMRAPESYMLSNGQRILSSKIFTQDDSAYDTTLVQYSDLQVKTDYTEWTLAEINRLSSETISRYNAFMDIREVGIEVVYSEPLSSTAPAISYPASGATIATSSVNFAAAFNAPQALQGVRGVFQVARDSAFTSGLKTFYSGFSYGTAGNSLQYVSQWNGPSFTDLGPGLWYVRVKAQDVVSQETAYSATTQFTVSLAALPTAKLDEPSASTTVVSPYSIRRGTPSSVASDNRGIGLQWNFSKSSTFASGIVDWTNWANQRSTAQITYDPKPITGLTAGLMGNTVSASDASQYLSQGIWYGRVRTVDKYGQIGAWSSAQSFTVSHPALATNTNPTANQVIDQDVRGLRWTFNDPWTDDNQTAYQVLIYDEANTLIKNSGKVSSTAVREYAPALATTYRYRPGLRWTVQLWDRDDVSSTQLTSNVFKISTAPSLAMAGLAQGGTVTSGQPVFSWTPGIAPGALAKSWSLVVRRAADNSIVYQANGTTETSTQPPQIVLKNTVAYTMLLTVTDSDGLTSTLSRNFTASYVSPPDVIYTVDFASYDTNGYVYLDWSSFAADQYFISWRIYRRKVGDVNWTLIFEDSNQARTSYQDWMVTSVDNFQYVVTQVADRSGVALESTLDVVNPPTGYVVSADYWLITPSNTSNNVRVKVNSDSFSDDVESNEAFIMGRGRRVTFGTRYGIKGTLSVHIRDTQVSARDQMRKLRALQDASIAILMRDPYGNITKIALGESMSFDRIAGVGPREFADVSIPYREVY